jgi:carbonic anhydrase/acetyltransferase-like protein (isoleucine patch superfamily)
MPVIVPFGNSEPRIDPTAWVAPNATLVGDVTLEANASVFYGVVIRADRDAISVGEGSNVQDNVVMHTDVGLRLGVGAGVSIGHSAILHGCTIGDNCLIGMGATIMNGAVIGAGSLVAAGALVLENTAVPPGSLVVGTPAKVVRALGAKGSAGILENARHYLELAREHREATAGLR